MSELIKELKKEHEFLAQLLGEVRALGPTEEGLAKLMRSRAALLGHLKKEDSFLYPELERAAAQDPRLRALLDDFASDMRTISTAVIQFLDEWKDGGDPDDFVNELDLVISTLQSRIRREETLLYPEFTQWRERKGA